MKRLTCALIVLSTLSLQAQTTPDWLIDLRLVEAELIRLDQPLPEHRHFARVPGETAMAVEEIRTIASFAKTPADLDKVLLVLPTQERRDRAYKTLISFTRWQPQSGFTDAGMMHGNPNAMEHHK